MANGIIGMHHTRAMQTPRTELSIRVELLCLPSHLQGNRYLELFSNELDDPDVLDGNYLGPYMLLSTMPIYTVVLHYDLVRGSSGYKHHKLV